MEYRSQLPPRRYGKFTFKAPWWMINAIFEESDKQNSPAAVLVVSILRKYLQERGYGPKEGNNDGANY